MLESSLPTLKSKLEEMIVAPRKQLLADFQKEHKTILAKLPPPVKQPEPKFVGQKLPEDFITSGASAALVKKFQS